MAIDLFLSDVDDDPLVATISEPLLGWMQNAATVLRVASPFGRFEPYGSVTLSASTGDVASFASAVQRFLDAMTSAESAALPPLPVVGDERDPELEELDRNAILHLLASTLDGAKRADSVNGALVAKGE